MKKVNAVVLAQTKYISLCVVVLSIIMQAVFIASGHWSYKVVLGNLLSGGVAVLNFFLLGLTAQSAVLKDEKEAKLQLRSSQTLRTFMLFAVAAIGVCVPVFDTVASLVPLFFVRIAIAFMPVFKSKEADNI